MTNLLETNTLETRAAVESRPRMETRASMLLRSWRYVEHSLLRIIAGWGQQAGDWEDKMAVCHHVWLQAESVERLRLRLEMFPGESRKGAQAPVSQDFEAAMNVVLLAPTFADAMAGVHALVQPALQAAYQEYLADSHPVHDKPTHDLLRELLHFKDEQAAWFADFGRRRPHSIDPDYAARVREAIVSLDEFGTPRPPRAPYAASCGVNVDFRINKTPGRVPDWDKAPNVMPFLQADWSTSVEARRLFFSIAYFWEMGVAESQLRWIYYADFMPWEFIYVEARHAWDESRHGDSGLARLRDFGLDIRDVGYSSYGRSGQGTLDPMTPRDVYEAFYNVTQIAETGYFKTKGYCFEDFRDGGDEKSAEMMQFDIIDETSHTEYGRDWLDVMATRAGVDEDAADYRRRGVRDREAAQARSDARASLLQRFIAGDGSESLREEAQGRGLESALKSLSDPKARAHYEHLLQTLREVCPLSNARTAPKRPNLPM